MPAFLDLTGQRFGRLTVINQSSPKYGRVAWWCMCDCGNTVICTSNDLRRGSVSSCGCLRKEIAAAQAHTAGIARGVQLEKHGLSGTRLYAIWKAMRQRCTNPRDKFYPDYGGRGISICPEWDDFSTFHKWAMETGYDPSAPFGECTIDRINNDDGYNPTDCRWVTLNTQANNRRRRKTHANH